MSNKTTSNSIIRILLIVFCIDSSAADPKPIVAPLNPGLAWKIERLPASARILGHSLKAPSSEKQISGKILQTNRIGKGFREQTLHRQGSEKQVRLIMNGIALILTPDGSYDLVPLDKEDIDGQVCEKILEGFDWLDQRWFIGKTDVDGVECLLYRAPWPIGQSTTTSPDGHTISVAIGVSDSLPRRVETPFYVDRFLFEKLEQVPLLPPAATKCIQEAKERAEKNARRYRIPQ